MSTRHLCRIIVLQSLYEWSFWGQVPAKWKEIFYKNLEEFGNDIDEVDFAEKLIKGVIENINFLDEIIKRNTKHWPYDQIPLLEKNILRIAIYEIYFQNHNEVPLKVSINEAVILAKSFISDISAKFINGVLGSVYEEYVNSKESIKS